MTSLRQRHLRLEFGLGLAACLVFPAAQAFGQVDLHAGPAGVGVQIGPLRAGVGTTPNAVPARDWNRGWGGDIAANGQFFQSSAIIGAPVMLQDGTSFGTLRDFVMSNSGCIEYAVVNYGNRFVPVPWGVVNFDFGHRVFQVGFGRDRLRDLPIFNNISELNNAQFAQRVHSFYRGNPSIENGRRRMANPSDANRNGAPVPAPRTAEPPHRVGDAGRVNQTPPAPHPPVGNREAQGTK